MNPEIAQLKMELPYYQEIDYTANIFIIWTEAGWRLISSVLQRLVTGTKEILFSKPNKKNKLSWKWISGFLCMK